MPNVIQTPSSLESDSEAPADDMLPPPHREWPSSLEILLSGLMLGSGGLATLGLAANAYLEPEPMQKILYAVSAVVVPVVTYYLASYVWRAPSTATDNSTD